MCSGIYGVGASLGVSVPVRCSFRSSSHRVWIYTKQKVMYFWGYLIITYKM